MRQKSRHPDLRVSLAVYALYATTLLLDFLLPLIECIVSGRLLPRMLRGPSRALGNAAVAPMRVAGSRRLLSHSTVVRNTQRSKLVYALVTSSVAAGTLWYHISSSSVVYNDAPTSPESPVKAAKASAKTVVEDEGLSALVWGSNKYVPPTLC